MSYTITPAENGKYIILHVTVPFTRKLAQESISQVLEMGQAMGINRYLLDLTESRNHESALGSYEFAYLDMSRLPPGNRLARVAMLVAPQDTSHDFNETVSRNAGLDVTLFRARQLAVQHLLQD